MKIIDVQQGSVEWLEARLGKPTASQFHCLITPATHKPSTQSRTYRNRLLAERLIGAPLDMDRNAFMERGTDLEPAGRKWYAYTHDADVQEVGFVTSDDGRYGCSPDGLVGDNGGLEIKCPMPAEHIANIFGMTTDYHCQVQGALLVTGREWWDLLSYHPTIKPACVRIYRDEEFLSKLGGILNAFCDDLEAHWAQLQALGCVATTGPWAKDYATRHAAQDAENAAFLTPFAAKAAADPSRILPALAAKLVKDLEALDKNARTRICANFGLVTPDRVASLDPETATDLQMAIVEATAELIGL